MEARRWTVIAFARIAHGQVFSARELPMAAGAATARGAAPEPAVRG